MQSDDPYPTGDPAIVVYAMDPEMLGREGTHREEALHMLARTPLVPSAPATSVGLVVIVAIISWTLGFVIGAMV